MRFRMPYFAAFSLSCAAAMQTSNNSPLIQYLGADPENVTVEYHGKAFPNSSNPRFDTDSVHIRVSDQTGRLVVTHKSVHNSKIFTECVDLYGNNWDFEIVNEVVFGAAGRSDYTWRLDELPPERRRVKQNECEQIVINALNN